MPNFGLVIDSTYNPMSFELYAAPFEKYALVYSQMADAYDALEIEANKWEKLANEGAGSLLQYNKYMNYANDLRTAANDLAENGLSVKTRGAVSNLRKRYSSEILPIEDLYNYREKLAEEQRKQNPQGDLLWDNDFSTLGLDALASNPTMSYLGRSLSELEKSAYDAAKAASIRKQVVTKAKDMGSLYYRISTGYNNAQLQEFLSDLKNNNRDNSKYKELFELYDLLKDTYGTNDTSIYNQELNLIADERLLTGMLKGLVQEQTYQTNHYAFSKTNSRASNSKSTKSSSSYDNLILGYGIKVGDEFYNMETKDGVTTYVDNVGNKYQLDGYSILGKDGYYKSEDEDGSVIYINDDGSVYYESELLKNHEGAIKTIYKNLTNGLLFYLEDRDPYYNIRYEARKTSGDNYFIYDLFNLNDYGQPEIVKDSDGNITTFDSNAQGFNNITGQIYKKQLNTLTIGDNLILVIKKDGELKIIQKNDFGSKHEDDNASLFGFVGDESNGEWDIINIPAEDLQKYFKTYTDEEFDNLSTAAKLAIKARQGDKYAGWQNLPKYIRLSPNKYLVWYDKINEVFYISDRN